MSVAVVAKVVSPTPDADHKTEHQDRIDERRAYWTMTCPYIHGCGVQM
jgi:hypothetical protein